MAKNNKSTSLTTSEAAFGRTGFLHFDYEDLQSTGYLSSGASGLMGAASQLVLDVLKPGEYIEYVTVTSITAAGGDTDFTIDVGTGNHSNTAPDNLLDAGALGGLAANVSLHGLGVADSCNTSNANVGLLMEFESLTVGNLNAGEWVIAWKKASAPLAQTQGLGD
tara:strand:- start:49 stop:543 length:495 start_codon:yes stop_codon:yes gene_type:complete